ncbi:hypothetical protein L204_104998 [Cryptococcus depauperatus]|nr:hypothetical protein L204_03641 [Cryptococcus depauperatus CBS 7855]
MSNNEQHEHHVIGGYKAALHNPNVSIEAKTHAANVIKDYESEAEHKDSHDEEVHRHRVEGGYKATLKNQRVSEGAKEHAREVLDK